MDQFKDLLEKIEKINPSCELLTTRKTFPFSKRFCIKATICGGATIHRLNLSETILFFDGHRILFKNNEEFYEDLKRIKTKIPEKKLNVESYTFEDSKTLNVDIYDWIAKEFLEEVKENKELLPPTPQQMYEREM